MRTRLAKLALVDLGCRIHAVLAMPWKLQAHQTCEHDEFRELPEEPTSSAVDHIERADDFVFPVRPRGHRDCSQWAMDAKMVEYGLKFDGRFPVKVCASGTRTQKWIEPLTGKRHQSKHPFSWLPCFWEPLLQVKIRPKHSRDKHWLSARTAQFEHEVKHSIKKLAIPCACVCYSKRRPRRAWPWAR